MIISHDHKFIYMSPMGKTACTSLHDALAPYGLTEGLKKSEFFNHTEEEQKLYLIHMPTLLAKEQIGDKMWNEYFKFIIVRNPWDWMVSAIFFNTTDRPIDKEITKDEILRIIILLSTRFHRGADWLLYKTQLGINCDKEGNFLIDHYAKIEEFPDSLHYICERVGIPKIELPHMNKTKHVDYTNYYNDDTKKLVEILFKDDIDYFGYSY